MKGNIIILNGVSSAGKTTLTRHLQNAFDENYFWIANDMFCEMYSSKHWEGNWVKSINEALTAMIYSIKALSDNGMNVIVDQVFLNNDTEGGLLEKSIKLLHNYPVLFVRVDCNKEELARREKARGDRTIGQAHAQLPLVHNHEIYDIAVDTSKEKSSEIVDKILDKLGKSKDENAFKKLNERLNNTGSIYIT